MPLKSIAALLALAGAGAALAQAPKPATPPCTDAESHQFDFWIGDWDVFTPDGKQRLAGTVKP